MGNPDVCHLTLSVLVPHSYRCRIELLVEFPNEHPFMQKVLISKANSMKAFMGVSKQEICITCLTTNTFRIHKMYLGFSHCLAVPGWCVSPRTPTHFASPRRSNFSGSFLIFGASLTPLTHLQTPNTKLNKIKQQMKTTIFFQLNVFNDLFLSHIIFFPNKIKGQIYKDTSLKRQIGL